MRSKSIPKKHLNPSVLFDQITALHQDLIQDVLSKSDLSVSQRLIYYHQRFHALFFNQELNGSIILAFWNDTITGYEQMLMIKKQSIFTKTDLNLDDLQDMMIVYDPPLYCFCTPSPFKYLDKSLNKKMILFQRGIETLFNIKTKPIFYPF